jgi:hypothetical protein
MFPNRSENNLNHPESFLLEREDILERWEPFHGLLADNLKVCDNLLHLPNKYLKDMENGRRGSETFLSLSETFLTRLEMFLRQPEDILRLRDIILKEQENVFLRRENIQHPLETFLRSGDNLLRV